MHLASDNWGPAHPMVMEALSRANTGYAGAYSGDHVTERAILAVRDMFEAPDAAVFWVPSGIAANVLSMATLATSLQTIFCSETAHIFEDECNGTEFFTGGAKLTLVPAPDGIMTPDALRAKLELEQARGTHGPRLGPISITQVTERGAVYSLDELAALTAIAREFGLPVHMDGARFANACAALGCTPAELTWKAGIDVLSFGGTKNGLMGADAVVFFNPDLATDFDRYRLRAGHTLSKSRYLAAQIEAYATNDLWRDCAAAANGQAAKIRAAILAAGGTLAYRSDANMIFANLPRATHQRLKNAGVDYHMWFADEKTGPLDEMIPARFVCDWSLPDADVDQFIALLG